VYDGVASYLPDAAFYNIAQLPVASAMDFCKWMLSDFHVNGETLMLAPAAGFYHDSNQGLSEVRIAYVLRNAELDKAMHILEAGLHSYPGVSSS